MYKKLQTKVYIVLCCFVVGLTGCTEKNKYDVFFIEHADVSGFEEIQDITEKIEDCNYDDAKESAVSENADNNAEADWLEEMVYPYDYLEADDPLVQEIMGEGWEDGFFCHFFIKGLVGYSPVSENYGGLSSYQKDREIIIKSNIGNGLLLAEHLAEVKEILLEMFMDMIRERGEKTKDYQKYFVNKVMIQEIETYLKTEVKSDWVLFEGFYLTDYAGNNDVLWWAGEADDTTRPTETDSCYNFTFIFYADYQAMEYEKDEEAQSIYISCAVSKETGLIEEIGIDKWNITRDEFETGRW